MDKGPLQAGHSESLGAVLWWAILSSLALLMIVPPAVIQAQVVTSITPTTGIGDLGTTVTHAGNLYDITGGTRPGNGPNLFHSFGDFSVGGGDIANFLNLSLIHISEPTRLLS